MKYDTVMRLAALTLLAASCLSAQSFRVIKPAEAKQFRMGKVNALRIVYPDMGAKAITLNHTVTGVGDEFAQHVHEYSDDTILILEGSADLRQGDSLRRIKTHEAAWVPQGQIHGTITSTTTTYMISFQTPPDLPLYTGERDSQKTGKAPQGVITPGAVKYVDFPKASAEFVNSSLGAQRIIVNQILLKPGESKTIDAPRALEQVGYIWTGKADVTAAGKTVHADTRDALFAAGPGKVTFKNSGTTELTAYHAQAVEKAK